MTAETTSTAVTQALAVVLADSYALQLKTQNYHWNVTGPHFGSLHALFQEQYTELQAAIDDIAEWMRALGAPAPGGLRAYLDITSIPDGDPAKDSRGMLADLAQSHQTTAQSCRTALGSAEQAGDEVTVDLMTQRLTVHEKAAWMLRSHLA